MEAEKFDIYKASAGSGKTYNLVLRYLKLLFKEKYYGDYHKRILAVTFTNKATEEMKGRIVKSLYQMTKLESPYIEEIMLSYTEVYRKREDVQKEAYIILASILDKYTNFNVRTIDSFFQQILRSFSREMSFYSNYRVELDKKVLIESVVDEMVNDLDASAPLYKYIEKFALMKVGEGASFNIKRSLLEMIVSLYDDAFVKYSDSLPNLDEFEGIVDSFESLEGNLMGEIEGIASNLVAMMAKNGLVVTDFKGGKNTFAKYYVFDAMKTKGFDFSDTFHKSLLSDDIELFASKANQDKVSGFVCNTAVDRRRLNDLIPEYHTLQAIKKNLYIVVILGELKNILVEKSKEENLLLMSSTAEFINKIIENSDAPFIYEKTGVFIDNYMIDEFQDTSILQWENFLPLLKESVASGNWNMVVGDVKQSIYRWREGDWSILNEKVEDMFAKNIHINNLKVNYRSYSNVIKMNNYILPSIIDHSKGYLEEEAYVGLNEDIAEARWSCFKRLYADLEQDINNSKSGSSQLSFIKHAGVGSAWRDVALDKMYNQIEYLRGEKGYLYSDICILVRENKEAKLSANFLIERGVPVVSNEALFVMNSVVVQFLLSFLRYMSNPNSEQYRLELLFYYGNISGTTESIMLELDKYVNGGEFIEAEWEQTVFGLDKFVMFEKAKRGTLYELIVDLLTIFGLNTRDEQYTQALLDIVFEQENNGNGDLRQFLEFWDKKGDKMKISMSSDSDSVQIYTIHKSKGMEYDIVFIPFCDWTLGPNRRISNYVWVENMSNSGGGLDLPIVPVDLGKGYSGILKTKFADKAREEYEKCCIDQLNIAYVGFTRAVKQLYVYSKLTLDKTGEVKNEFNVPYLMYKEMMKGENDEIKLLESDDVVDFTLGEVDHNDSVANVSEDDTLYLDFGARKQEDIKRYLRLKGDVEFGEMMNSRVIYGKVMHSVFETLASQDEVAPKLKTLVASGLITAVDSVIIEEMIGRFINFSDVTKLWFSGHYKVLNEVEILIPNGDVYRPDRVMVDDGIGKAIVVDYKFGAEHKRYHNQVKGYMKLLMEMGYSDVEGYISYIGETVKIEKVGK